MANYLTIACLIYIYTDFGMYPYQIARKYEPVMRKCGPIAPNGPAAPGDGHSMVIYA